MLIELTLKENGKPILVNTLVVTNIFQNRQGEVAICFMYPEDTFLVKESYEEVKDKVLNGK